MSLRLPSVVCASCATIAGSDSSSGDAGALMPADRWTMLIESSTVTACVPPSLHVDLGAAKAGQDQRIAAMHEVAAVELGRHVHGQLAVAQRRVGGVGIGRGGGEVAAHREEHLALAIAHRLDRADHVQSRVRAAARKPNTSRRRSSRAVAGFS